MTIQVGVPGAAGGGGGGGATNEIAQAGGRVTVEADGSVTIQPLAGFGLHVDSVGPHAFGSSISAPTQYQFRGDYTFPGSFGVKVLIRDQLIGESGADEMRYLRVLPRFTTQAAAESLSILAGMTVGIPSVTDLLTGGGTIAEVVTLEVSGASAAGVSNFALRVKGGLTQLNGQLHVTDAGPHAFGVPSVSTGRQFEFAGDFTAGGSQVNKYLWEGSLTASAGTGEMHGHRVDNTLITQTETEAIDHISGFTIEGPNITDNLTGNIVRATTLWVRGLPSAGLTRRSLYVTGGFAEFAEGLLVAAGRRLLVGGTNIIQVASEIGGDYSPEVSIFGTNAPRSAVLVHRTGPDDQGATYSLNKSRSSAINGHVILQDNDRIGAVLWSGDDGVDYETQAAKILARIDGSPAASRLPTELVFATAPGVSDDDIREVGRFRAAGDMEMDFGLTIAGDVGFYGTGLVAQQTGVAVTDAAIHAALVNLGLITA